jgi:hypothetical protein
LKDRPTRDPDLLDKIDAFAHSEYTGFAWRVVREGRDPLQPSRIGGRWDRGAGDALYTALDSDGAVSEIHFRLSQEPVFPSRYKALLCKLHISISGLVRFDTVEALRSLGVDVDQYQRILYDRTQVIGDAAQFLGRKGIIAPNARWPCLNLVLFEVDPQRVDILSRESIDWASWRTSTAASRRSLRKE